MDNSTISALSSPPTDILDVDSISIDEMESPEPSTSASTSLSLHRGRYSRPSTVSPQFIGYSFRNDGIPYTIRERTAIRKGGRPSHIWRHGTELFSSKQCSVSWMCNICWDKGSAVVMSRSNTTRPSRHLLEKHRIQSDGQIEAGENSEIAQAAQAAPITKSVLQQHIEGAQQRPSQLSVDAVLLALIQWIVLAHIALSCVELQAFRDLLKLLNPLIFGYLYHR